MWNGIWKLTVMVGVVGIGLFAVFQAQKGMTGVASQTSSETYNQGDSVPLAERHDSLDQSDDDSLVDLMANSERTESRTSAPGSSKDSGITLAKNVDSGTSAVKPALATSKSGPKFALASRQTRQTGLSFQDDDDDTFKDFLDTDTPAPQSLPDEILVDDSTEKLPSSAIEATDESSAPSEEFSPDTSEDPFQVTVPVPVEDDVSITDEPASTDAAAKTKKAFDFGEESEIPRSKRGLESAGRKREAPEEAEVETESKPERFDREPKAMAAPPAVDPEKELFDDLPESDEQVPTPSDDFPATETEEHNGESKLTEPEMDSNSVPETVPTPKTLPLESQAIRDADSESEPRRTTPQRNRLKLPAAVDLEDVDLVPSQSREPAKRKIDRDQIMPSDMVGDGIAGDVTQRGVQQPRLTIEKIAQQQAVIDQPLVYTIIVKNNGNVAAHNVVVEDRIPKGTELLGTAPRAELSGKTLVWKEEVLRPNEEKKISIKVVPKQEGPIGSVARVHFATEVTAEIQVAAPQLSFTVDAPTEVRLGQNFDLVFQLKNVGKVEASNISVRDLVPDNLKHETGNDIECPIGKLAPNEVREIVLPVVAVKTGNGTNRAVLTADTGIQKQLESPINVVGEQLVLTRSGQNRVYVERPAVFTNRIRNDGNMQVPRIRIAEIVPAGMEFETASDGGKFDRNLNAVVWTLGPLGPGDDKSINVRYVPKETGTLEGKITATGATGSTATIQSSVDVVGRPELQMETLSVTGTVTIGDKLTSKIQLKNSGTAAARNVQLKISLPPELRLLNVRGGKFQKEKNVIVFDSIDELSPRKTAAFELVLEATEEADARVIVEILADHLSKPHRREETVQIARDSLK